MFPYIFNERRSKLFINSRNNFHKSNKSNDECEKGVRADSSTFAIARQYILDHHPRLVHIGLSGTDAYGHKKRYQDYLAQANLADRIISSLWQLVQSSEFYRGNTTFIITTDHGRGATRKTWSRHGFFVKGSSQTWMALLGNGVKHLGESKQPLQLHQKQVAGTIGHFFNVRSFSHYTLPINCFAEIKSAKLANL
jgi:membrane-anchored protein YejM (alkaline phosphatase superfamily)